MSAAFVAINSDKVHVRKPWIKKGCRVQHSHICMRDSSRIHAESGSQLNMKFFFESTNSIGIIYNSVL
jgi:hypothetical protein